MLFLLLSACTRHIPAPLDEVAPLPASSASVGLCWVEFATGNLPRGVVAAHHVVEEDVVSTASGLLVVHGDRRWLLDGGYAEDLSGHLSEVHGLMGLFVRKSAKDWARVATPTAALAALGGAPEGLIASHGHYDHLGGLLDLPELPVWLPADEIALAQAAVDGERSSIFPGEAAALLPRAQAIPFGGPSVGPWPTSWDLFGDGSVRLLPMPGHTPGSVGTLIQLADGRRVLHVGDAVWVREGYEAREPKAWLAGSFDSDHPQADLQIQRLWQLHQADPELLILPAHDRRQWEAIFLQSGCIPGPGVVVDPQAKDQPPPG